MKSDQRKFVALLAGIYGSAAEWDKANGIFSLSHPHDAIHTMLGTYGLTHEKVKQSLTDHFGHAVPDGDWLVWDLKPKPRA